MDNYQIHHGDCLDVLKTLTDNSIDAVVTDPPYGLSFMGKHWDYDVPTKEIWAECLRVLKPGGYLLAFAGTRTQHRMAVNIEDAGFEIRDMIAWVYGSGFPKSLDVSKAIDKAAGAEREIIGQKIRGDVEKAKQAGSTYASAEANKNNKAIFGYGVENITAPATDKAKQWQGWGTALKPALEPITVARKPLIGTVADNVMQHGTGALNIDGCRISTNGEKISPRGSMDGSTDIHEAWSRPWMNDKTKSENRLNIAIEKAETLGRWPANFIHDGSDEVLQNFPETKSGNLSPHHRLKASDNKSMSGPNQERNPRNEFGGDTGSAARFFYCAKASKQDRDEGLEKFEKRQIARMATANGTSGVPSKAMERFASSSRNNHPTVKPTDLMRYLCRLVTSPKGIVLDPFMGSGSTGKAALLEGFNFVGIEREAEYVEIAKARIESALKDQQMDLF